MYDLFHCRHWYWLCTFNDNISGWDVSKVTNMGYMFVKAYAFNQPIGSWDVSKVADMGYMFYDATDFSQNLSTWCVKNVGNNYANFHRGSALTTSQLPVWGTCPA